MILDQEKFTDALKVLVYIKYEKKKSNFFDAISYKNGIKIF